MGVKRLALALRHEKFCLALLAGDTAADAARKAGYGRKPSNVRIIAWALLHRRKDIPIRLAELSQKMVDDGIMTIVERKVALSKIAMGDDDPIRAIVELNRMDGLYRGEKKKLLPGATSITVSPKRQSERHE